MSATVRVSRFTAGLHPGDGEKIGFKIGEEVSVICGQDEGRRFVVTSDVRIHADAPGKLVREGYFTDDPTRKTWCKLEGALWPVAMPESMT